MTKAVSKPCHGHLLNSGSKRNMTAAIAYHHPRLKIKQATALAAASQRAFDGTLNTLSSGSEKAIFSEPLGRQIPTHVVWWKGVKKGFPNIVYNFEPWFIIPSRKFSQRQLFFQQGDDRGQRTAELLLPVIHKPLRAPSPKSPPQTVTFKKINHCPLTSSIRKSCMSFTRGKRCDRRDLRCCNQVRNMLEQDAALVTGNAGNMVADFSKSSALYTPQPGLSVCSEVPVK